MNASSPDATRPASASALPSSGTKPPDALAKIKRRGDYVFHAYTGKPLGIKGAELRFRNLREAAKVKHVTSSQLRDGAYTVAVAANVNPDLCKLLVGHRCGLQDNYVRQPRIVAPACVAVYQLTAALRRGIAFHYGNMPLLIRNEIERLFRENVVKVGLHFDAGRRLQSAGT